MDVHRLSAAHFPHTIGQKPGGIAAPPYLFFEKRKAIANDLAAECRAGAVSQKRFRRNGFEEMDRQHGLVCVREIDHKLYSAAERRRFGSYVTADSLVFAAKNVQAGFGSTKRVTNNKRTTYRLSFCYW